jgi:hypothetical protein
MMGRIGCGIVFMVVVIALFFTATGFIRATW